MMSSDSRASEKRTGSLQAPPSCNSISSVLALYWNVVVCEGERSKGGRPSLRLDCQSGLAGIYINDVMNYSTHLPMPYLDQFSVLIKSEAFWIQIPVA